MSATGADDDLRSAWEHFDAVCNEMRDRLEETPRYRDHPEYRNRGYASLMEAKAWAYNFAIAPRLNPHVQFYWHTTWNSNVFGLGQPIQDFRYGGLFLDGRKTYRITGSLGALKLLLMQVHTQLLGHPDSQEIGNYDFHFFDLGPGKTFDVIASGSEQPGNWIRLDPASDYNFILIRKIAGDWADDLGTLEITEVGAEQEHGPDSYWDIDAAAAIRAGAEFARYLVRDYTIGLYDLYINRAGGKKNAWASMPGRDVSTWLIGSPSVVYVPGVFAVDAETAVIIEWDPPPAAYWSMQIADVWSKPLDYMHRQTDINMERAAMDSDGKFRAVISLEDPGVANWLDPNGNREGTMVVRAYRSTVNAIEPTVRAAPVSDLMKHLPDGTRVVSPEQRRAALDYRRRATFDFFHR